MKLLLDENLPKRLKQDLTEHEVYTVRDKGWNGKKNGELMKLLVDEKFDTLLTFDKNFQHQQNFSKYSFPVLVLNGENNTYLTLQKLIPKITEVLNSNLKAGSTEIKI
jgi:predicted nuclease of predicted toxin-antitoxin system